MIPKYAANFLRTVVLNAAGQREKTALYPTDACYQVTWRCQLNCVYCCENQRARPEGEPLGELGTEEVKKTLAGIRRVTDFILFTGGEPTLREDLPELLAYCRKLGFSEIILNSNGLGFEGDLGFLRNVHAVLLGIDCLSEQGFRAITRGTPEHYRIQMAALERLYRLQRTYAFDLRLCAVMLPDHLCEIPPLLDWCFSRNVAISISPAVAGLKAYAGLRDNPEYRNLTNKLVAYRKRGLPLFGTAGYFRTIRDFSPFTCMSMSNLTVTPMGKMRWPCGEAPTEGPSFCEGLSYPEMISAAQRTLGRMTLECTDRCHIGCRLLLSDMITKPWQIPGEALHLKRYRRFGR